MWMTCEVCKSSRSETQISPRQDEHKKRHLRFFGDDDVDDDKINIRKESGSVFFHN